MPTYEYACASCHRHTELVQRFTDPPLTECPHCGGSLRRVFHPVGIVLKGSGFYSTDNRGKRFRGPQEPTKAGEAGQATDAGRGSETGRAGETGAKEKPKPAEKPKTSKPSKPEGGSGSTSKAAG